MAFFKAWYATQRGRRVCGPVGKARKVLKTLGWQWLEPWTVETCDGLRLQLRSVEPKQWAHEVREGLRLAMWRSAATRREDMDGVGGNGIDRVATTKLLQSARTSPAQKGMLRSILTGAVWTGHRQAERRFQAALANFARRAKLRTHVTCGGVVQRGRLLATDTALRR